jgi:hypothetical protein
MGCDKENVWGSDAYTYWKGYIFACFSELAYLQRTKYDLPSNARYKIVPSETLENLQIHDLTFNLEQTFKDVLGVDGVTVNIHDPGRGFLYATFRTPYFVVVAVRGIGTRSISRSLTPDGSR